MPLCSSRGRCAVSERSSGCAAELQKLGCRIPELWAVCLSGGGDASASLHYALHKLEKKLAAARSLNTPAPGTLHWITSSDCKTTDTNIQDLQ
ncbi:hypothetical protein AOLI_G00074850 [Acnodon oligacanthus]